VISVKKILLLPVFSLSLSVVAQACPDNLKNFHSDFLKGQDVCQLHDRYQAALDDLRGKNFFPPERLSNLMAPRFINLPDWNGKKDRTHDSALRAYDPAPITWKMWESGVKIVDKAALKIIPKEN
jgi:alpha-amylase/alpha-mannosidase (GH57 family)